jgi:hypothetical protein
MPKNEVVIREIPCFEVTVSGDSSASQGMLSKGGHYLMHLAAASRDLTVLVLTDIDGMGSGLGVSLRE